jgi:glycosyltransferase involved in cell wall biosynthesis
VVHHGVNGFLASSEPEWFDALDRLVRDHRLRLQLASEARRTIEASYSLQTWAPRMLSLIDQLLGKQRILERETIAA